MGTITRQVGIVLKSLFLGDFGKCGSPLLSSAIIAVLRVEVFGVEGALSQLLQGIIARMARKLKHVLERNPKSLSSYAGRAAYQYRLISGLPSF